jgi:hypothetical protein
MDWNLRYANSSGFDHESFSGPHSKKDCRTCNEINLLIQESTPTGEGAEQTERQKSKVKTLKTLLDAHKGIYKKVQNA